MPGQADDDFALADAGQSWLARLDRQTMQNNARCAGSGNRLLHIIAGADRAATRNQDQIRLAQGLLQDRGQFAQLVAHDAQRYRQPAGLLDRSSQHRTIGIKDQARRSCVHLGHRSRGDELIPRRHNGHPHQGSDSHLVQAQGGNGADFRSPEPASSLQDELAGLAIITTSGDLVARRDTAGHQPRLLIELLNILDHDHGICSGWQHAAGCHGKAFAGL